LKPDEAKRRLPGYEYGDPKEAERQRGLRLVRRAQELNDTVYFPRLLSWLQESLAMLREHGLVLLEPVDVARGVSLFRRHGVVAGWRLYKDFSPGTDPSGGKSFTPSSTRYLVLTEAGTIGWTRDNTPHGVLAADDSQH
jgi:hypothetical protein